MFDPVPRSHMFMIDARRMSGSGCCSSTQRAQEPVIVRQRQLIRQPDIYTAADRFWNSRINRNYPHLTRLYLRTYHSSPDYRTKYKLREQQCKNGIKYIGSNMEV